MQNLNSVAVVPKRIKKMCQAQIPLSTGRERWFSEKLPLEDCVHSKQLGHIKHQLIEELGLDTARIRIDWNRHEVNINGKIVAVVDTDGALTRFGEADQVKEEVESFMALSLSNINPRKK